MERIWEDISKVTGREMTKAKTEAKMKMGYAGECEKCFPYLHICLIKISTYSINGVSLCN